MSTRPIFIHESLIFFLRTLASRHMELHGCQIHIPETRRVVHPVGLEDIPETCRVHSVGLEDIPETRRVHPVGLEDNTVTRRVHPVGLEDNTVTPLRHCMSSSCHYGLDNTCYLVSGDPGMSSSCHYGLHETCCLVSGDPGMSLSCHYGLHNTCCLVSGDPEMITLDYCMDTSHI